VHLSPAELQELNRDIGALASLYKTWNELYLASIRAEVPPWIAALVEYGLTPAQCAAHRLVAKANLEPMMARVDYIDISVTHRKIAEVQWKSGGPGFFYGHALAFQRVFPPGRSAATIGNLAAEYLDTLVAASRYKPAVIINEVRAEWLAGESHLRDEAQLRGISYFPINRSTLSRVLNVTERELVLDTPDGRYPVTVFRGRGFTDVIDDTAVIRLAKASVDGTVWIETPINFVYRQKWGMALPYIESFSNLFDKRITEIVTPTALVMSDQLDLTPIVNGVPEQHRDRISSVKALTDLPLLPSPTRRHLIMKCGTGVGDFHNRGRGVFRLGGSSTNVAKLVEMVCDRVLRKGEPWILQPFVDCKYSVPIALPSTCDSAQPQKTHARILVFGGRGPSKTWKVHGAIGNFGRHWKVSGSRARTGQAGELLGSAFTDVRVETNSEEFS
jgi:hypothetical protein